MKEAMKGIGILLALAGAFLVWYYVGLWIVYHIEYLILPAGVIWLLVWASRKAKV